MSALYINAWFKKFGQIVSVIRPGDPITFDGFAFSDYSAAELDNINFSIYTGAGVLLEGWGTGPTEAIAAGLPATFLSLTDGESYTWTVPPTSGGLSYYGLVTITDAAHLAVPATKRIDFTVATNINPLTMVYDALWTIIESHPALTSLVRVGNRVKDLSTLKDQVSTVDLPEIRIICQSAEPKIYRTSSGTTLKKIYQIQVATGEYNVQSQLHIIEWELLKAFSKYKDVLDALTWNSKRFILQAKVTTVNEGTTQADLNRGIRGWVSLWTCEVEFWFDRSDLQA